MTRLVRPRPEPARMVSAPPQARACWPARTSDLSPVTAPGRGVIRGSTGDARYPTARRFDSSPVHRHRRPDAVTARLDESGDEMEFSSLRSSPWSGGGSSSTWICCSSRRTPYTKRTPRGGGACHGGIPPWSGGGSSSTWSCCSSRRRTSYTKRTSRGGGLATEGFRLGPVGGLGTAKAVVSSICLLPRFTRGRAMRDRVTYGRRAS